MLVVCDTGFGSFNFFMFDTFPTLNVKEGARGYTWVVLPVVQDFVHQL